MARGVTGRESDERLLEWLRLRCEGIPLSLIAELSFGASPPQVSRETNRVRNADAAESGEDVEISYSW